MQKLTIENFSNNIIVDNNKTLHYLHHPNAVHCFISATGRGKKKREQYRYARRHADTRKDFLQKLAGKRILSNTGPVSRKTFPLQIVNVKSPDITNKVNAGIISHKTQSGSAIVSNSFLNVGK